jgi:CelD/BcsL family acetyltransferase involved in cellulose biosynthesis
MQPDFRFENFYQYSCLDEHPVRRLKRKRRSAFMSEIRRAETAGVELVPARTIAGLDAWLDIYEARYAEIGATGPPRAYLRRLWEVFAPTDHAMLRLAKLNGRLLGGTLFLLGRGIVDYFISVFTSASTKFYPGTLLLHRALERFMDEGVERFNWQSSPSRDSGVYAYKKRWGAVEATYPILTRVLGDIKPLLERPLSEIRQVYNGHFVLPYELWETS